MKRLLLIFILTLSFQSWIKADDIRDFEIEGLSIGDSLLDYFSEDKIKDSIVKDSYKHKDGKFLKIDIINHPFKFYDVLSVHVKNLLQKEYLSVSGMLKRIGLEFSKIRKALVNCLQHRILHI